jgi:heme exporter protein C
MASQRSKGTVLGLRIDGWARIATVVGFVLITADVLLAFFVSPLVNGATLDDGQTIAIGGTVIANRLLLSQKIFYLHVPVAMASFAMMAFTCFFGIRFLMTKDARYDLRARITTELALVFILATMFSGDLWERFEWGVWWTWEPRLTTYFILMLLIFAYFVLRASIEDPERRATYAAVFGIVAFIDVPISFMVTRLIPSSVHPVVFRTDSGLPASMLVPFLLGMAGVLLVSFAFYRLRLRESIATQRIEILKQLLEEDD